MNIVLIGYRCSGKSVIGEALASELCRKRLDTDRLIEDFTSQPIEDLIPLHGWSYFRKVERNIVKKVSAMDRLIISTGGGAVMDQRNIDQLKRNGWLIWLDCCPDILVKRMESDRESGKVRPPLMGKDPILEIKEVLKFRRPFYERAANYILDTSSLSIKEATTLILKALPERAKG